MQQLRGAYALDAFAQILRRGDIMDFQPWKNSYHSMAPTVEWEQDIENKVRDMIKWIDETLLLQK